MKPRAVLFDLYGTLIHISTDEHRPELWGYLSRFLAYRGLSIDGLELRRRYFQTVEDDLQASAESYPDVDVLGECWSTPLIRSPRRTDRRRRTIPSAGVTAIT